MGLLQGTMTTVIALAALCSGLQARRTRDKNDTGDGTRSDADTTRTRTRTRMRTPPDTDTDTSTVPRTRKMRSSASGSSRWADLARVGRSVHADRRHVHADGTTPEVDRRRGRTSTHRTYVSPSPPSRTHRARAGVAVRGTSSASGSRRDVLSYESSRPTGHRIRAPRWPGVRRTSGPNLTPGDNLQVFRRPE